MQGSVIFGINQIKIKSLIKGLYVTIRLRNADSTLFFLKRHNLSHICTKMIKSQSEHMKDNER